MPIGYDLRRVHRWLLMNNRIYRHSVRPSVVVLINDLHRTVGRYVFFVTIFGIYASIRRQTTTYRLLNFILPSSQKTGGFCATRILISKSTIVQHYGYEAG